MRALLLTGPGNLDQAELPEPIPDGRVVVGLEQVGICGTDLKIYKGSIPVHYPRVLGHELVGRVLSWQPHQQVPEGARVLINPSIACGRCPVCRAGRANLCPTGALLGRDVDGGFVERIAVGEEQLHLVPETISPRASALLQVLGTCVHAQDEITIAPPDMAVVIGLGVAGLLHVELLHARGIRRIIGISRSKAKRDVALQVGAASAVPPEDALEAVRDMTDGAGADLVVEAVGTVDTLGQAVELAALGATLVVFGTIASAQAGSFPWYDLYLRELKILNPRAALPRDYDRAISLAARGELALEPLWSRSFPLAEGHAAFEALMAGGQMLKVSLDL